MSHAPVSAAAGGHHESGAGESGAGESGAGESGAGESGASESGGGADAAESQRVRDIADVPAIEVITTTALHLMSAAAVKCGLAEDADAAQHQDLDEARKLITALAGLVTAAAPEVGSQHATLLRDGLKQLQLAFREALPVPDPPGRGPGEKLTGRIA